MIHHIVLHAPGAKWGDPAANCFSHFFAEGEENQEMPKTGDYGIANMTAGGEAPSWFLTHMLMNHRGFPFKVYVRTKITYSDTPKTEVTPLWIDTEGCDVDPTYTVRRRRPEGLDRLRPRTLHGADGRPHHRRPGPPARRRQVPDAPQHLVRQRPADQVAGLLRASPTTSSTTCGRSSTSRRPISMSRTISRAGSR